MSDLTEHDTLEPSRKVVAATAGSALFGPVLVGVLVWLGFDQPPAGLEGGLSVVGAFVFGYWFRERAV